MCPDELKPDVDVKVTAVPEPPVPAVLSPNAPFKSFLVKAIVSPPHCATPQP